MDGRRQANIHQLMLMSADLAAQHHLSTETKTPGAFDFSSGLSPLSHSEKSLLLVVLPQSPLSCLCCTASRIS